MERAIDVTFCYVLDHYWTIKNQCKPKDDPFKVTVASLSHICCYL